MEHPIRLPLRIRERPEAIAVIDAAGVGLSYVNFEGEPGRRSQTKRVSKAQAIEIARLIARAMADRIAAQE